MNICKKMAAAGSVFTLIVMASCSDKNNSTAAGYFESETVIVSSEATGRLLSLNIEEGDRVTAGESVGSVDSVQLYLNKMQLRKNFLSIRTSRPDVNVQTAALKSQLANLEHERDRVSRLVAANSAPSKQLDDIDFSIATLKRQIEAQTTTLVNNAGSIDAQSSAVEIQIALMEDQLEKCRLVAPVSGTVISKYANAGEFATVGKPLYKVADMDNMTLKAYVTSDQLADLKLGQQVKVKSSFGGGNDRVYDGTVTFIASESEFTPKNIPTDNERADLVYAVKIKVKNDGYLKIGTYGQVIFK